MKKSYTKFKFSRLIKLSLLMAPDYQLSIINGQQKLSDLADQLESIPVIALDIETIEWWNRQREQIALIHCLSSGKPLKGGGH